MSIKETFNWLRDPSLMFVAFRLGRLDLCSGWGAFLIAPDHADFSWEHWSISRE